MDGANSEGWASQRSRHPLGRRLEPVRADWARLADALPTLAEARTVPRDREAGFAALSRYGEAVAAVESGVLGRMPASQAIVTEMLSARLMEVGGVAVPVNLRQGADEAGQLRAWATALHEAWPPRDGARERRLLSAYVQCRLLRFARRGEPAPLPSRASLLFTGWRAARGG